MDERNFIIEWNRPKRFSVKYPSYSEIDYSDVFDDLDLDKEDEPNLVLLCVFLPLLCVIFFGSIISNVTILMVFARKQALRTTSNRSHCKGNEFSGFFQKKIPN